MARPYCIDALGSAEEWFRQSEAGSLEHFPIACQDLDCEGVIRGINGPFCDLLGYEKSAVVGKNVWAFVAPEEVEQARRGHAQKLAGERHLLPFERSYAHASGHRLTVQVHDALIKNGAGVIGIRSALVDVSDRRRREMELEEGSAFAEALISALPDGVIVMDALGTVISMNGKAEALAGRQERDCIGRPIEQVLELPRGEAASDALEAGYGLGTLVGELLVSQDGVRRLTGPTTGTISEVTLSFIMDAAKTVIGFLAVLR